MQGFKIGFISFFKAIPFIFKNKLWWTFLIPLILNIILYLGGVSITDNLGDWFSSRIDEWILISSDSKLLQAVPDILAGIAKFIMQAIFFFIFMFFSGYIILILLSPILAWISEKTDNILNETDYPFEFKQFAKDVWRGILIAIRNLFFEIGITLAILIATFIPILGQVLSPVAFIIYFLFSSYFYGFSYMDYTNERKRLNLKQSVKLIRKYRGLAIANGALFSLSLLPFCGVALAGFTAIIATVGATLAMNNIEEFKDQETINRTN